MLREKYAGTVQEYTPQENARPQQKAMPAAQGANKKDTRLG
jgi:hypothetical protein